MTKRQIHENDSGHGDDKSRPQPVQPDPSEQSGSTGRPTGDGTPAQGKDTGQGRYGQSGLGGGKGAETEGQASYRNSGAGAEPGAKARSNPGSGRVEHEAEEYRGDDGAKQTVAGLKPEKDKPRR